MNMFNIALHAINKKESYEGLTMLTKTLADYIGTRESTIEDLLQLSPTQIYQSEAYQALVAKLDRDLLHQTLPEARGAYEQGLPRFKREMGKSYDFDRSPMSAFTLGNWLVGFLQQPDALNTLPKFHGDVPRPVMREGLPHLLSILDRMGQGRQEWQQALAVLSLPLVCGN